MAAIEILPPSKNVSIFSYEFGHICFQIYNKKLLYYGTEIVGRREYRRQDCPCLDG